MLVLQKLLSSELLLELLKLLLEPGIRINDSPALPAEECCLNERQPHLFHEIGNYECGRPRNTGPAMNEYGAARLDHRGHPVNHLVEVARKILAWRVEDVQDLVLEFAFEHRFDAAQSLEDVRHASLF